MERLEFNDPELLEPRLIPCFKCGEKIKPNAANMCLNCIYTHDKSTENICPFASLTFCRGCERYLQPPAEWIYCALESREMMSMCLKRVKGLNKVKLINSEFIWTEPHSRRVQLKLTMHVEILGVAIEKVAIVTFTVENQMCPGCHRLEAKDHWKALVQVRQKSENKKTFYYLEQLILKHGMQSSAVGTKKIHGGLDFFYETESHAKKMVDFLLAVLPCKYQHSKKLKSHDIHSNTYNYKFTFSVEIVPLSKDSVVCLPKKLTHMLGGISPICLIHRVTNAVHLIDPASGQVAELKSTEYWRYPFNAICNPKQLVEYMVMNIEPIMDKERTFFPGQGPMSRKHVLADVWITKTSDLGSSDQIHTRTHLGHVLKVGDLVFGYNVQNSNINDPNFESLKEEKIPDVILVKKFFGDRVDRRRRRIWKLRRLAEAETASMDGQEFNEFMEDLEEDPEMRKNINLFRDTSKTIPVDEYDNGYDSTMPGITLDELLDDMDLNDVEMAE